MESYDLTPGTALAVAVTLKDGRGATITTYTGAETLAAVVWPGGPLASLFAPSVAWTTPGAGLITWTVSALQSATLTRGRYYLRVTLTDGGTPVDAYECALVVADAAGSGAVPPAYTTYQDLLRYGKSWLGAIQTGDDGAGFLEEQGRARSWLEDCAHAHFRVASMAMVVGGAGIGPRRSSSRSVYLTQQLAANTLMVTDALREAVAKKALAYVCEGQLDGSDGSARYAKLARMFHSHADYLALCNPLQIDTDQDGYPDFTIDLSSTDTLFG
jgi:hypothetical protein